MFSATNFLMVWILPKFHLRSNFTQEIKDFFDVAGAFLPAAVDFLTTHLGSTVAVNSWSVQNNNSLNFFDYIFRQSYKYKVAIINIETPHEARFYPLIFFHSFIKDYFWTTLNRKMLSISQKITAVQTSVRQCKSHILSQVCKVFLTCEEQGQS